MSRRTLQLPLLGLCCLLLAACAGTPAPLALGGDASVPAAQTTANPMAAYDPWTGFNRHMYRFNAWLDDALLLPVVHGYRAVTPEPVRDSVGNFFSNIGEINTFANAVLQLKPRSALTSFWRFAINSTIGIGGLFDPSSAIGLLPVHEDFGQTLAVYGVDTGPYLVLPFFGPSTLRDSFGLAADQYLFYALDPLSLQRYAYWNAAYLALYAINKRNNVGFRYYQTGSPFEYELVRFIYLNMRALQVAR